jgi:hypothetical protein
MTTATLEAPPQADVTPPAEAPPPAEAAAWPAGTLWKAELRLEAGGAAGELQLVLRLPAPDADFLRAVFAGREQATAPLPAARQAALASAEHQKMARLEADLAAARVAGREAGERARHALRWARQALGEGNDPTPHEEAYRKAKLDADVYANRAQALEQLSGEARAACAKKLAQDVERTRRGLHVAALGEAERLQKEFVAGCAALLQPLLVAQWRAGWFGREAVAGLADLPTQPPRVAPPAGE